MTYSMSFRWIRRYGIARFVSIGRYFINTDRVLTVTPPDYFGSIWIEMDNGHTMEVDARYLPDILGTDPETSSPQGSPS